MDSLLQVDTGVFVTSCEEDQKLIHSLQIYIKFHSFVSDEENKIIKWISDIRKFYHYTMKFFHYTTFWLLLEHRTFSLYERIKNFYYFRKTKTPLLVD